MNVTLTSTPVQLDLSDYPDTGDEGQILLLENLGTGDVYFDRPDDVDETTGVKMAPEGNYELPLLKVVNFYFMSDTTADLRFTVVG